MTDQPTAEDLADATDLTDLVRAVPPDSADLSGALGEHLAEAAAEREETDFAFRGIADGALRALAVVAADLEPHIRAQAADNLPLLGAIDDADAYDGDNPVVLLARQLWETVEVGGLVEEAGEAHDAYARMLGTKRRAGTEDEYLLELADVVISAFICAHLRQADLARYIERKLQDIYARGWSE